MEVMATPTIRTEFWRGKKVLLTGHTGFKGSWLGLWLSELGAIVTGVGLEPASEPNLFSQLQLANRLQRHHIADIRDVKTLAAIAEDSKPELVLHLAAQPLVRRSYEDPLGTWTTNVIGSLNLLEALKPLENPCAVVMVTTDKVYANREWIYGYREPDRLGGHDPYSASKAGAEIAIASWRSSFCGELSHQTPHLRIATARAGNVIGGGDWAIDRLIPDVLRSLQDKEQVLVRNPHAIRPWQHVLEPLCGYLQLAECLYTQGNTHAEEWNFGPNEEDARPVEWVVEHLCSYWGADASWTMQTGDHPHEATFLKLDSSKARQRLNWKPRWSIETALKHITEWHQAWMNGQDVQKLCLKQIKEYLNFTV
tara:strand:+ start:1818 stop:2918 length:1101 start_codon:yes stop_codon:yes gene_type:complete